MFCNGAATRRNVVDMLCSAFTTISFSREIVSNSMSCQSNKTASLAHYCELLGGFKKTDHKFNKKTAQRVHLGGFSHPQLADFPYII